MKQVKIKRSTWILYAILVVEILILTYFVYRYGINHIDSDDSAEMILARLLNEEGGILTKNWYYSTELRVLNTQLIMAPLFSLFDSWRMVRTVGTLILLVIYIISFLVLCSRLSFGTTLRWLSPVLLWPFSMIYYDFVLFGLYYIPHLVIVFFSLSLYFGMQKKNGSKFIIMFSVLMALACLAGMGGLRMLVVLYMPWAGALFFSALMQMHKEDITSKRVKSLLTALSMAFASGIGYLINAKFLSAIFSFASWEDTKFIPLNFEQLGEIIKNILEMAGYRDGRGVTSIGGIVNIMIVLMVGVIIYFYIMVFKQYKKLKEEEQILALFSLLSILATVCVGIFTDQNWSGRYMILPLINFVFIWGIYLRVSYISYVKEKLLCMFVAGTICISGLVEYRGWMVDSKTWSHKKVLEYLQANDYPFGYADWWGADVLTELADGEINMCKITNWKDFSVWYWLMDKNYEEKAGQGKVFVMIENSKMNFSGNIGYLSGEWKQEDLTYLNVGEKVYDDGTYSVYSYENLVELKSVLP